MPAYARDGKVVRFFQSAHKFNSRYATFGFNDAANLDEGAMWPTSFALKELTAAEQARIGLLTHRGAPGGGAEVSAQPSRGESSRGHVRPAPGRTPRSGT